MTSIDSETNRMRTSDNAPVVEQGLGPNQLKWLRLNIDSFRHAERQLASLRHDALRAARIACLI
jgi:hypothetical protein